MNTKYEELKQKASKGPFHTTGRDAVYCEKGEICRCDWQTVTEDEANAQLIAHTLNHFDELLEALETAKGGLHSEYCGITCCNECKQLDALIKNAKEVSC